MATNFLDRVKNIRLENFYKVSKYDSAIFKLYQDYLNLKNLNRVLDVKKAKKEFADYILMLPTTDRFKQLNTSSSKYIWGMKPDRTKSEIILNMVNNNQDVIFAEDAFLKCIVTAAQLLPEDKKRYQISCGYILDDLTLYIDATRPSRMELILNSDFKVTDEQKQRAKSVIKKIIDNKISKYNNQPIVENLSIGTHSKKVLVIDQSYKDYSIIKGMADDNTFKNMLDSAIKENPDTDIIIKTHPDTIGKNSIKQKCYYQNIESRDNIYRLSYPINPISLIEYVDKVYVCSSQFGFEALMCGKEVHTFGMPFYANWGLTIDSQKCKRRIRKRTLEEVFYIAYIYMAQYINPDKNEACEIEESIDYLIEERERYFKETNI